MNHNDTHSLFEIHHVARFHRKRPTRSEALLWAQLKGRKLGARFRRQAVLGSFVVDFFAPCHKLVVEIDGGVHDSAEARRRDEARQREIEAMFGVRFVRVRAELVERDVLAAVAVVRAAINP